MFALELSDSFKTLVFLPFSWETLEVEWSWLDVVIWDIIEDVLSGLFDVEAIAEIIGGDEELVSVFSWIAYWALVIIELEEAWEVLAGLGHKIEIVELSPVWKFIIWLVKGPVCPVNGGLTLSVLIPFVNLSIISIIFFSKILTVSSYVFFPLYLMYRNQLFVQHQVYLAYALNFPQSIF